MVLQKEGLTLEYDVNNWMLDATLQKQAQAQLNANDLLEDTYLL